MSGMPSEKRLWRGRFSSVVERRGVLLNNIVAKRMFFSLVCSPRSIFESRRLAIEKIGLQIGLQSRGLAC